MKAYRAFALAPLVASVLAGCGGGAAFGDVDKDLNAQFRGAFQMNLSSEQCVVKTMTLDSDGLPITKALYSYDELIFGSDNTGYRICGDTVWVGKFSGTMVVNGGTAAGNGSVNMTVYNQAGAVVGQTGTIAGAILSTGGPVVDTMTMQNDSNKDLDSRLSILGVNIAYRESITGSYATLAGTYNSRFADRTLTISSSGVIAGKTSLGSFSGSVTAFHADTQVHDVSLVFTPTAGGARAMTGVIGPYGVLPGQVPSNLPNGDAHPGVLLAIAGGGTAYADVYAQK